MVSAAEGEVLDKTMNHCTCSTCGCRREIACNAGYLCGECVEDCRQTEEWWHSGGPMKASEYHPDGAAARANIRDFTDEQLITELRSPLRAKLGVEGGNYHLLISEALVRLLEWRRSDEKSKS